MQKIILTGRVGKDPEEKFINSNRKLVTFSLAVSVTKEFTQWYSITIWNNRIDFFIQMLPYIKKGSMITVIGDLNIPTIYTNKNQEQIINMSVNPFSISFVNSNSSHEKKEVAQEVVQEVSKGNADVPKASWMPEDDLPF